VAAIGHGTTTVRSLATARYRPFSTICDAKRLLGTSTAGVDMQASRAATSSPVKRGFAVFDDDTTHAALGAHRRRRRRRCSTPAASVRKAELQGPQWRRSRYDGGGGGGMVGRPIVTAAAGVVPRSVLYHILRSNGIPQP